MAIPIPLPDYPLAMQRAVAYDALGDAKRVGCFLKHFLSCCGLFPARGKPPLLFPRDFLMELGAALRLLTWEANGIHIHRAAGLPPAEQALRDAFFWLKRATQPDPGPPPLPLALRVLALSFEHFAWGGRDNLDADILLAEAGDDAFIEALADFLWTHRHQGRQEPTANEA